jgi:hypothetical protein
MSRHFVPITVDELKKKIEDCRVGDQWVEYRRLTPIIEKDLDKVIFDTENISDDGEPKDLLGGDWESPVFFCIYWDGRKLRAYVPEKGNLWKICLVVIGNHQFSFAFIGMGESCVHMFQKKVICGIQILIKHMAMMTKLI